MNKNQQKLVHYCYDLLARRRYSIREIIKKLEAYNHKYQSLCTDEELQEILEALVKANLVNDTDYAYFHVQAQLRKKPVGAAKLRQQLRAKGVDEPIIMQTINKAALDEKALAHQLLLKKTRSYTSKQLQDQKIQARLLRYLAGNGFTGDVIYRAIRDVCQSGREDLF